MNLIQESFHRLFPDKELKRKTILNYNLRLGDFNSNIKLGECVLQINLNLKWKNVDDEIKIGLIQTLLLKMFAKRYHCKKNLITPNIEFYNNFVKKIPLFTPKTKIHPDLEESFHRVNQSFFNGILDKPNLTWGIATKRKLACYNFHNDTVTVSNIFKDASEEILDYLVYHELLHKKQKFYYKNGRNYFHTRKFKEAEDRFPNKDLIERQISGIIRQNKQPRKSSFLSFFSKNL